MSNEKKKVVIADDEAYITRVLKLKLTNAGYDVTSASDGLEALEIIKSQLPDVLITDINMPKLDGKGLFLGAAETKKEKDFLTIVMTCSIDHKDRSWIPSAENVVFIEKPFSPKQILKIIQENFK